MLKIEELGDILKYIYLFIAFIMLCIGMIGIALPILPTTPFLLVASVCFAKGSNKFHRWFINSNLYKNNLENFIKNREMTLKTKIFLMIFSSTMIIISIFIVDILYLRIMLVCIDIFKYYYFIFKIKTI